MISDNQFEQLIQRVDMLERQVAQLMKLKNTETLFDSQPPHEASELSTFFKLTGEPARFTHDMKASLLVSDKRFDTEDRNGECVLTNCKTNESKIVVPDGVTVIGDNAFLNCDKIISITLPDGLKKIYSNAFQNCTSLESIKFPYSLTEISYRAFFGCSKLRSVTIPNNVKRIGDGAFKGCSSLESIILPDGLTSIGSEAFSNCSSLDSITIPDSVMYIGILALFCKPLNSLERCTIKCKAASYAERYARDNYIDFEVID